MNANISPPPLPSIESKFMATSLPDGLLIVQGRQRCAVRGGAGGEYLGIIHHADMGTLLHHICVHICYRQQTHFLDSGPCSL